MNSTYITSAAKAEQLPDLGKPEIAFIGRSNVGKSTLLNLLVGQRNLARASREPGRTRMVNFFDWGQKLILADLPGYGFIAANRIVQKDWTALVQGYLERPQVKALICMTDGRRPPNEEDLTLWRDLAEFHKIIFVVTKIDKLNQSEREKNRREMQNLLAFNKLKNAEVYYTSATKRTGVDELRKVLLAICEETQSEPLLPN